MARRSLSPSAGPGRLIVPTGQSVLGLEPTRGTVLWRYVFGRDNNTTATTPVWINGLLWVSAAYGVGSGVLEITGQDGVWTVKEKWRDKKNLHTLYSNAMIVDGYVYGCHGDIGAVLMKCLDFKTGEVKWDQRLDNRHWLLAFDGHILSWNETGTLQLFDAKPAAYEVKAELPNLLAQVVGRAVLANGRLYLRDQKNAMSGSQAGIVTIDAWPLFRQMKKFGG